MSSEIALNKIFCLIEEGTQFWGISFQDIQVIDFRIKFWQIIHDGLYVEAVFPHCLDLRLQNPRHSAFLFTKYFTSVEIIILCYEKITMAEVGLSVIRWWCIYKQNIDSIIIVPKIQIGL